MSASLESKQYSGTTISLTHAVGTESGFQSADLTRELYEVCVRSRVSEWDMRTRAGRRSPSHDQIRNHRLISSHSLISAPSAIMLSDAASHRHQKNGTAGTRIWRQFQASCALRALLSGVKIDSQTVRESISISASLSLFVRTSDDKRLDGSSSSPGKRLHYFLLANLGSERREQAIRH